jgi:hypothetical protein
MMATEWLVPLYSLRTDHIPNTAANSSSIVVWHVSGLLPSNDLRVCSCMHLFSKPLPNNGCLFWLHYFGLSVVISQYFQDPSFKNLVTDWLPQQVFCGFL